MGRRLLAVLGLFAACALAGYQGIRATRDLDWPADPDLFRDISVAQAIRSGHPLSDPAYLGEWAWYNPLVPATVAVVSIVAGRPVHVVYSRLGAYANLLAPISLFALLAVLFDSSTALAATLGFLFLVPGREPAWTCATYSPWLLPLNFVQALFYLALLMMARAWSRPTARRFAEAGAALGVVLLGHTAPALILSVVATIEALRTFVRAPDNARRGVAAFAALVVAALLVSTPLLVSIVGHYRLVIRNPAPAAWVYPELDLSNLPALLGSAGWLSPVSLIAGAGLVRLIRVRHTLPARAILLAAFTTLGFFGYSYLVQYARSMSVQLPALVPGFHFLFYLRAFEAMAFGIGVVWLGRLVGRAAGSVVQARGQAAIERTIVALVCAGLAVAVGLNYDAYSRRPDFTDERANALRMFSTPELRSMYEWISHSTNRSDVFLARNNVGLSVIAPAGRKVVLLDAVFSNPFVDWAQRARDRDEMVASLQRGDWKGFLTLAGQYRVRFVAADEPLAAEDSLRCCLRRVWVGGRWIIYWVG